MLGCGCSQRVDTTDSDTTPSFSPTPFINPQKYSPNHHFVSAPTITFSYPYNHLVGVCASIFLFFTPSCNRQKTTEQT
jgi:hypothetical protein